MDIDLRMISLRSMIKTLTIDKVAQGGFKVKRGCNLGEDGLFKDGWTRKEEHSKDMEKEWLERLGMYWRECYYGNPGRREFKVGVAVMSKAAEA